MTAERATGTPSVDLTDLTVMECPYPAYQRLRDEAPVYYDARADMYIVTRFADVRAVLTDAKRFVVSGKRKHPKHDLIMEVYRREGAVIPAPSLSGMDNPEHKALRRIYNDAFTARKVAELEQYVTDLAEEMIDRFAGDGRVDVVNTFAIPFTTRVIGHIMGIESDDDLTRIRGWAAAWIDRLGMMSDDRQVIEATELEVEAQRYFQPIIDRLRAGGESVGLFGYVVRTEIAEWGRPMNDSEAQGTVLASMFVAGTETAASVIGEGMRILVENPSLRARLAADPELIPAFVEEILRTESPAQGLFRRVTEDVDLGGVLIPAGATVVARPGAGNRDEREFGCPAEIRLDRDNGHRHLAFGQGTHACMGAPLARLEIRVALRALISRLTDPHFVEGANDFAHNSNLVVRGLKELHVGFTPGAVR